MGIDLSRYITDKEQEEACEHTREVASKYGVQIICDENDDAENGKA